MIEVLLNKEDTKTIKGFAIILVVLSHMAYIMDIPPKIELLTHPLGYLGVSLFLAVSGYGCSITSMNKKNYRKGFFERRLRKIVPLLSAITIIAVILSVCLYEKQYKIIEIGLNAIGITSSIGKFTWYIAYQYFWYVIFYIVGCDFSNRKKCMVKYFICSLIVYIISVTVTVPDIQFNLWGLNCFSFPFGIGVVLYSSEIKSKLNSQRDIRWIVVGMFVISFIVCYGILRNPSDLIYQNALKSIITLSFCAMVFVIVFTYRIEILKYGRVQKIGEISFELYLIHGYWIFVLGQFFEPKTLIKDVFYIITIIIASLVVHALKRQK